MDLLANSNCTSSSLILSITGDRRYWLTNVMTGCTMLLLAATAIVGNVIIVTLVCWDYELHQQVSNIMILNLAVVDTITAVTVMLPSSIAIFADNWPFANIWCTAHVISNYLCMGLSLLSITALSVDRLISVVFPLRYSTIVTHRRMLFVLMIIYVIAIVFALNAAWMGIIVYDYWEAVCAMDWFDSPRNAKISVTVGFVTMFLVPSLLILGSNCYIVFIANLKSPCSLTPSSVICMLENISPNNLASSEHNAQFKVTKCSAKDATIGHPQEASSVLVVSTSSKQLKTGNGRRLSHLNRAFNYNSTAKRVFYSILTVTICFFACLTPYSVIKFTKMITNDRYVIPNELTLFGTILQITNSMVNPFIYGILRKDFRRAFCRFRNRYFKR